MQLYIHFQQMIVQLSCVFSHKRETKWIYSMVKVSVVTYPFPGIKDRWKFSTTLTLIHVNESLRYIFIDPTNRPLQFDEACEFELTIFSWSMIPIILLRKYLNGWRPSALVKISASWLTVLIDFISILPCFTCSRIAWYLTSMCLRRFSLPSSFANDIALRLYPSL